MNELERIRAAVRAYDDNLDAREIAPTGDEYNEIVAIVLNDPGPLYVVAVPAEDGGERNFLGGAGEWTTGAANAQRFVNRATALEAAERWCDPDVEFSIIPV